MLRLERSFLSGAPLRHLGKAEGNEVTGDLPVPPGREGTATGGRFVIDLPVRIVQTTIIRVMIPGGRLPQGPGVSGASQILQKSFRQLFLHPPVLLHRRQVPPLGGVLFQVVQFLGRPFSEGSFKVFRIPVALLQEQGFGGGGIHLPVRDGPSRSAGIWVPCRPAVGLEVSNVQELAGSNRPAGVALASPAGSRVSLHAEDHRVPKGKRGTLLQEGRRLCPVMEGGGFRPAASKKVGASSLSSSSSSTGPPAGRRAGQLRARGTREPRS